MRPGAPSDPAVEPVEELAAVLNRELVAKGKPSPRRGGWCWTWTAPNFSVYSRQATGAYNGHFESTCYHPLLLFNGEGDCLRPGNVHSAEGWEELLLPEIDGSRPRARRWPSG